MNDPDLLIPLAAIIFGSLMFLIPIAAFSLRFAAKPLVEAMKSWREGQGGGEHVQIVKERVAFLEQRLELMEDHLGRLDEAHDFDKRLQRGQPAPAVIEAIDD
ncbi:MAG: hypothetical protein ABFS34_13805 [Gemmatimonadota bacterium]